MDNQGNNLRDFLRTNGHVVLERVDNNSNLRSFTEKEIKHITDGYSIVLGKGQFGEVYKGKFDDGRPVAVKRYINSTRKEEFAKEVIVHSQINHKNVVRLMGCCTEENALMIVMEFMSNGNMYNILHCNDANRQLPFPLEKRLDVTIEIAEVLSCMHSMYSPVLHGDIKPANILLDENLKPKISDFGIARLLSANEAQHTKNIIGSIGYLDPLYTQTGFLTPKSDVYSFGVVLLELITRKKAADGNINLTKTFTEAHRKWKKVRQMFDEEIANNKRNIKLLEDMAKLAVECLKIDGKKRPEMVEIADRLRMIRKVLKQHKGRTSTGSNNKPIRSLFPATATISTSEKTSTAPIISLDELKEITWNFSYGALISEGQHASIFLAELKDGQKSALKRFGFNLLKDGQETALKNISTYAMKATATDFKSDKVLHSCLNALPLGVALFISAAKGCILISCAATCTLYDILHGVKGVWRTQPAPVLSWVQRVKIAVSVAEGLEFLHNTEPPVIHNDFKSSNMLLFGNDFAKFDNTGISRWMPTADDDMDKYDPLIDRPPPYCFGFPSGYEVPGRVKPGLCNTKSDVYRFGIVLLELLTGRKPFDLGCAVKLLVDWARPRLNEYNVGQYVDQRLDGQYPQKDVAKMAAVAAQCVQIKADFRPNMSIVVKDLRPLLNSNSCLTHNHGHH